ncbi:MAG TPA: glycine dehydrogenase, partial [Dictyoglomaceae bacterium]|nr:glycine dehydrogenase [Dictyoglomaceae bacterium]
SFFFNEFILKVPKKSLEILKGLETQKILGGIPLSTFYPERDKELLISVTEMNSIEDISYFISSLKEATQ